MIDAAGDSTILKEAPQSTETGAPGTFSAAAESEIDSSIAQKRSKETALAWADGVFLVAFVNQVLFLTFVYNAVRAAFQAETLIPLWGSLPGLAVTYVVFVMESLWSRRHGLVEIPGWCYVWPPLRMTCRDAQTKSLMWMPGLGWTPADRELSDRIARGTTLTLILLALYLGTVAGIGWLRNVSAEDIRHLPLFQVGALCVWIVIVMEFFLLASLARRWLEFLRRHRLHVVIGLTPMLLFLRLALLIRILRGIFQFDAVQRVAHRGAHRRLRAMERELITREEDIAHLRQKIEMERQRLQQLNVEKQS